MKLTKLLFFFLLSWLIQAQEQKKDSLKTEVFEIKIPENQSINDTIKLESVVVGTMSSEEQKQFILLQRRVRTMYPYARLAAEKLTVLNKGLANIKSGKEKNRYLKIAEEYLTNEFEAKLKKHSRKQGQILIKLIYRQTGQTTYQLIKDIKSGFKAFTSNIIAKTFDLDLKRKYEPYKISEDFLIETILARDFERGILQQQTSAYPIDYENLRDYWLSKK